MARPRKTVDENPAPVRCRVIIHNLWTSKGKFYQGQEVDLPPDEAALMDTKDQIKIVRQ